MKILISACLLGVGCRYDGASRRHPLIARLAEQHDLVPVCPEQLGGLATPRPPAERQGDRIIARDGTDVTEPYLRGAEEVLHLCHTMGCRAAVLKERSPSCGHGEIYDGTFTGTLTAGDGITASLLRSHGIALYGESEIESMLD